MSTLQQVLSRAIKASFTISVIACVFHKQCALSGHKGWSEQLYEACAVNPVLLHRHMYPGTSTVYIPPQAGRLSHHKAGLYLQNDTGYVHTNSLVLFLLQIRSRQNRWKDNLMLLLVCSAWKIQGGLESKKAEIVPVQKGT